MLWGRGMSIHRIKQSPNWHFCFQYQGHSYRRGTKTTDRSEAEAIERAYDPAAIERFGGTR
jgi:hypothetical protein